MKRTLMRVAIGMAALLSGCVAVPAFEPTYAPPAPADVAAPHAAAVHPYLYAHWGSYYRGPYGRYAYR